VPAAAELTIDSLDATHSNGSDYSFPVVAGDSPAASRINTYLQVVELYKLPGRYREIAFEDIWPEEDSWQGTTSVHYQVEANQPGFLVLAIYRQGMGAHPSSSHRSYNFDARTGAPIRLQSVFTARGLAQLREQLVQQRLQRIDDFISGKVVEETPYGPLKLRDDSDVAKDQKRLYRDCRSRIERSQLDYDDFRLGEDGLTVEAEECAPHALRAIDDLGAFANTLPYAALGDRLNDFGRCLLLEGRTDCQRRHDGLAEGVYRGQIGGRYPITLVVEWSHGRWSASYFYDKHATRIELSITRADDGSVQLDEKGPPPARFELRNLADGRLQGHWAQEGRPALAVELR
jgi:hypothetical protein